METISVRATLGLRSNKGRNLTRKTFSFQGFEQEHLAQKFVGQLDTYLHEFITTCDADTTLMKEELFLVRPIGSTKGCCRTADIIIHASNNFEMLLKEMLSHFGVTTEHFVAVHS
jgi:hypothetical protein